MIKCAVFDMDGTLVDSMPMWRDITYEYAELKGIKAEDGLHHKMNRLSLEQCAELYIALGAKGTVEEVTRELGELAYRDYRDHVEQKPHAAEFLKLLHDNGVGVAVATASIADGVKAALAHNGMAEHVDLVLTCSDVGKSKESPDIFLKCAEHFGAAPNECVVFEDSAHAIKTAKEAGFPVVAIADNISMDGGSEALSAIRTVSDRCISDYIELIRELAPPEDDDFHGALSRAVKG